MKAIIPCESLLGVGGPVVHGALLDSKAIVVVPAGGKVRGIIIHTVLHIVLYVARKC